MLGSSCSACERCVFYLWRAPLCTLLIHTCVSQKVNPERAEAARGTELLLAATLLHRYCVEDEDTDPGTLEVRRYASQSKYR